MPSERFKRPLRHHRYQHHQPRPRLLHNGFIFLVYAFAFVSICRLPMSMDAAAATATTTTTINVKTDTQSKGELSGMLIYAATSFFCLFPSSVEFCYILYPTPDSDK